MRYSLMGCLWLWGLAAMAAEPVSTGWLDDTAIGGRDTVAYHRLQPDDAAVAGNKTYVTRWKDADWYFASEAEQRAFAENPEHYAPAYNGFCANALSLGEGLVKTNGRHWAVLDNQLFLFYSARGAERWLNNDYRAYKKHADRAWQEILHP